METQIELMNYETAFSQLESVLSRLERDDLPLEEALSLYERGSALAAHCSKQLEEAESRVRQWQANSAPKAFDSWQEQ